MTRHLVYLDAIGTKRDETRVHKNRDETKSQGDRLHSQIK